MTEPTTLWLTGCVKPAVLAHAHRPDLGVLITPDTKNYRKHIEAFGGTWAADNACFSQADPWVETEDMSSRKERAWLRFLDQMTPWADSCLWATVPDVVGDHGATLARFARYSRYVRALGYRVAFVVQNGATPASVPWESFDAMFIGGVTECEPCGFTRAAADFRLRSCPSCGRKLTEWKESAAARALVREAQARGKAVHMGRVNGVARLALCAAWGIDSGDGTYIAHGEGEEMTAAAVGWLDAVNRPASGPAQLPLFAAEAVA